MAKKARKNKKGGDQPKSAKGRRSFGPLIGFLLAAVCAGVLIFHVLPGQQLEQRESHSENNSILRAKMVEGQIANLQARLAKVARSAGVSNFLSSATPESIARLNSTLAAYFPQAESIVAVPLREDGAAGLSSFNIKLRNNIEALQINQAEKQSPVKPEAYRFNEQTHFSLAAPSVNAENKVVGALLGRFPIGILEDAVNSAASPGDKIALVQTFNDRDMVLLDSGEQPTRYYSKNTPIGTTPWTIRYEAGNASASGKGKNNFLLLGLLALPALLLPLLHFITLRSQRRNFESEVSSLQSFAEKMVVGEQTQPPEFETAGLADVSKLMRTLKKNATKTTKPQAQVPVESIEMGAAVNEASTAAAPPAEPQKELPSVDAPDVIFRAYDIRGEADKYITDEVAHAIGMAIGSEAIDKNHSQILLGADARISSPRISTAVNEGLLDSGIDVIDIGMVPTPLMYFGTHHLDTGAGVMITGSHNAKDCNGIKLVLDGKPLSGEHIKNIRHRIQRRNFHQGAGSLSAQDLSQAYIETVTSDIAIAMPLKVCIDGLHGMGGPIGIQLLEELGCEVHAINCEPNGDFPKHSPDPTRHENLAELCEETKRSGSDFGLAFDGDADRVCFVDGAGTIIEPDTILMLLAQDVVSRNPGADIIFDVKCSRHLGKVISNFGGRPIMWKSGHSCIKEKMLETGALLGGEYTGHICFKERWYGFDDGIYGAARLVEIVSTSGASLDQLIQEYPASVTTPEILLNVPESQKFAFVKALADKAHFGGGKITTIDGIRVDYPDGWGLVRASNTVSAVTLRFEADDEQSMTRIQSVFREQIGALSSKLAQAF